MGEFTYIGRYRCSSDRVERNALEWNYRILRLYKLQEILFGDAAYRITPYCGRPGLCQGSQALEVSVSLPALLEL